MKKLIITTAAVFFIGLTAFAQDGNNCPKSCKDKCATECKKDGKCDKKCGMAECTPGMKCDKKDGKNCASHCKMEGNKNNDKKEQVK